MFSYTPNSYQPIPQSTPLRNTPNYEFLCRSSFRPRALQGQAELTQSVCVHPTTGSNDAVHPGGGPDRPSFSESVQVVPETSGGFRVLRPGASISSLQRQPLVDGTVLDSHRRFSRNISTPIMQDRLASARQRLDTTSQSLDSQAQLMRSLTLSRSSSLATGSSLLSLSSTREPLSTLHESLRLPALQDVTCELQCSCKRYHSHTFDGRPSNKELEQEARSFIDSLVSNTEEAREDSNDDMRNIFWTPSLSFHPYHHGDKTVQFSDLWPSLSELRQHFENSGVQRTVLRDSAILDLCKLAVTCGPLRLLRCLFELELVRVDQQMDHGTGMLHLAVLAHNVEAIQYLTASAKISPKLRDRTGKTADQLCYSGGLRRHLPPRYQVHREPRQAAGGAEGRRAMLKASVQDKDTIFKLAANPKYFDEIQKKLQTLDFNINTECDTNGDFLLHIACRRGLSQLPLIMALVKIQGADVELCNADGITPLMLAASTGNQVLCDVLMCLFGADPNKPNPNSGRCALHYAVEGNHRKTVECLIRRGADVNSEDHMGRRPDDVPLCKGTNEDCHEVIQFNRKCRTEKLCECIRKGELEKQHILHTDLFLVDDDGYTLVMKAAIYNKAYSLEVLLLTNDTTIDAQHVKTGMTALSIAAQMGNVEAVEILLSRGANPAIADMKNYLPLHYAVLNNQEKVVDSMLDYFPQTYCGLYAASRLCKRTSIHVKLKSAFIRRQEEIVTPKLLACAMRGAADELFQLLDEGDNINPKSGTGNWPLYLAVENGHLEVVKLLCQRGGDIRRHHTSTGETVLHIAAKMGHTEITRYLLGFCRPSSHSPSAQSSSHRSSRRLLDINTPDANNRTPLQVAAEKGFSKIVELLVQHGATTALLDAGGQLITVTQFEGVRMQIESLRQQHTKDIVTLITDRSKKAFEQLQKIWLPRFDHNLRTRQGDTPLMVACGAGKLQIVKFLLESAVYSPIREDNSSDGDDDSDADSGVLAPSGGNRHPRSVKHSDEELQASGVFSQSTELPTAQDVNSGDFTLSVEGLPEDFGGGMRKAERGNRLLHSMGSLGSVGSTQRSLEVLLHDVNRPKGLYIFHDGLVSHVCAVSLRDGSTALHRAIEQGDSYQLVRALLTADRTCINLHNDDGFSPLHLACKLGRKKIIEMLLTTEGTDLNARTLDCLLPEETTNNRSIIRMVQKARLQQYGVASPPLQVHESDLRDDLSSTNSPSHTGSVVNFDKLHSRYEALRKEVKSVAPE
ncbi:uncharacterized protein LOC143287987 isoform X2 [Babylonia areolata]|uniref:uncharacterized protein LOC143287987 isoform X2 n=1 Tax=Babylonia areolata TaxID=304850 RepID=UPI003FD0846B